MRLVLGFLLITSALLGCTVGETCVDAVEAPRTTELGVVSASRCGIGHCMTFGRPGGDVFRMHLPEGPGTYPLEELAAELCTTTGEGACVPVAGKVVARAVHRPELGRPAGRLDADFELAHPDLPREAHIDYEERLVERCRDETWPDFRGMGMFGPS